MQEDNKIRERKGFHLTALIEMDSVKDTELYDSLLKAVERVKLPDDTKDNCSLRNEGLSIEKRN